MKCAFRHKFFFTANVAALLLLLTQPNRVIASGPAKDAPSLMCSLSFAHAVAPNINTVYIPFTLVGRLIIVQAAVDNVKGNFIIDTGAERLLLNSDYISMASPGRELTAIGNTGLVSAKEYSADSLRIEQLKIRNLLAHLVNLDHIEVKKNTRIAGIIGYHVFRDFELFIDFPNDRIVLSRVDKTGCRLDTALPFEKPFDSLSFELKKHFIVVKSVVNNVRLEMILDSGAELNLIDRRVNRRVLEKFSIIKRVNLIGAGKKQVEVLAGVMRDVSCGNQQCPSMNTLLTSLDEINTTFGMSVNGVLGYEFLSERRTMINYKKRKIYFFSPLRS